MVKTAALGATERAIETAAASVTRWWNKSSQICPNIIQKVAKSILHESCNI